MKSIDQHPLHSLFWPQSVAVIGASPDVGKIRGRLLSFLVANGFAGKVVPINPSHQEILGLPCFPSVAAAGEQMGRAVDVALIAIPAQTVLPELERCAAAGVRHAVIISSGFAEEGGESAAIQEEIALLAKRTGMRVSGPNAEGYYNALTNLAATFTPTLAERPAASPRVGVKKIGIVAQSGGVGFALFQQGRRAGLDFSYVVTTGNEADLGMAEFVEYMAGDEHTAVIFLYVETIRDAQRFERAALRARAAGKHLVVVKIGQSESGSRAAASHTAAMAGWNVAYGALFARCGVFQALDMEEALAMCCLLVTGPLPTGKRVAIVTASGGAGAWAGDTVERLGGSVPLLSPALQNTIREHIPSYGGPSNPVDVTAQALRSGGLLRIVDLLMDSDEVDEILVVTSLAIKHFVFDMAELTRLAATQRKPFAFYSYSIPTELALDSLAQCGVACSTNLSGVCNALVKLAQAAPQGYGQRDELPAVSMPVRRTLDAAASLLCEYEVKDILRHYGVDASRESLATSEDAAVAAADAFGYPVVLKVQSPLLPHKTEIGGVRLDVKSAAAVRAAYQALMTAAAQHSDAKELRGILVQRMAPRGHEIIVGTLRDPAVGPLVLVGFGGVAVELYRDVVYRMAPVDADGARAMLDSLKSAALLKGFRGQPVVDVEPLARLIAAVSRIAFELSEVIDELELNPVIVHADNSGLTIADGLMRKRPSPPSSPAGQEPRARAISGEAMTFDFTLPPRLPELDTLRDEVRAFLRENIAPMSMPQRARTWHGCDAEFSRKVAARGWIGMTWQKRYGGGERTALERYVVLEEMVSAGAPVSMHWTGDRQSGPLLLRYGTEAQRETILPRVTRGEIFFCIGLSEPDAGSDLANLRTRAVKTEGGWIVNGTKVWTSGAHLKQYMIMLCRSRPRDEQDRHAGMSQFLIDLALPGIQIRPIPNLAGDHHFNEVVFTDCFVPDDALIGVEGNGWKQAMSELAFERSGPERFLSSSILLRELVRMAGKYPSERAALVIGRLAGQLATLRRMSFSVASALQAGVEVGVAASFVKDLGSVFEQSIPDLARDVFELGEMDAADEQDFLGVFRYVMLASPAFSIYGGTREILRSIIGKSLAA